jgi:hypothetical protein
MEHSTPMITEALRALGDADGIKLLHLAADRLEELQRERDQFRAETMRVLAGFEVHSKFAKERDEARAEVGRLKKEANQAEVKTAQSAMMNTYERFKLEGKVDELKHTIKTLNKALDEKLDAERVEVDSYVLLLQEKIKQLKSTRPEPSRLEIAAQFMVGSFLGAGEKITNKQAFKMADELIAAAAKEGK